MQKTQKTMQPTMKKLYEWCQSLATHAKAKWALAGISFIESSFFPVPPDVILAPMVLADKSRAWFYAFICTLASVLGAILGYIIGRYLFELIGTPILEAYSAQAAFEKFTVFYADWGFWIVIISAISFVPFKVATIASGVVAMEPIGFLAACIIGRAIRFYGVTAALMVNIRLWLFQPLRRGIMITLASLGVLAAVFAFEYLMGLAPCPLCLNQRIAFYLAVPLGLLAALTASKKPSLSTISFMILTFIFLVNSAYGGYHAGIEWGYWPGPASCAGNPMEVTNIEELILSLENGAPPSCSEAPWRLFGLSLAGYNMLASLGLALLAGFPILFRRQETS